MIMPCGGQRGSQELTVCIPDHHNACENVSCVRRDRKRAHRFEVADAAFCRTSGS